MTVSLFFSSAQNDYKVYFFYSVFHLALDNEKGGLLILCPAGWIRFLLVVHFVLLCHLGEEMIWSSGHHLCTFIWKLVGDLGTKILQRCTCLEHLKLTVDA